MKDFNKVLLIGRLGADPTLRKTKSGTTVVHISVATSRRIKEQEETKDVTQWHQVIIWGKYGENCSKFLKKGERIFVEGTLRSRTFEGKDGIERRSFEIHAQEVNFLGSGKRSKAFGENQEVMLESERQSA